MKLTNNYIYCKAHIDRQAYGTFPVRTTYVFCFENVKQPVRW